MNNSELWNRVHSGNYVFEAGCWKTCSGFCCANGHADFNFRLMPMKDGTTILYMGPEYRWMSRNRMVLRDATGAERAECVSFDFGGPQPLTIYHVACKYLGACEGKVDKPFLCKIYPFFPILDDAGKLEELYPSSIFELTFALRQDPTPCTVASKQKLYREQWNKQPEILAPLNHPTVIFYLRAAKHFMDNYSSCLASNTALKDLKGKAFWQAWEMAYLSGKLIATGELKRLVLNDYNRLREKYGDFEI